VADVRRGGSQALSLHGLLLLDGPRIVAEPLDFTGTASHRLGVLSQDGLSWTSTRYLLVRIDVTDPYQPGRPLLLPDLDSFEVTATDEPEFGAVIAVRAKEPPGGNWHGKLSSSFTSSSLASDNLPPPPRLGSVRQSDSFRSFSRNRIEVGGRISPRADLFAAIAGQWASQNVPLEDDAHTSTRMLFGTLRSRLGPFDLLYTGSRLEISNGGIPAGIEAYTGRRWAPPILPGGFAALREDDGFDSMQAGWSDGRFHVRYGATLGRLNATPLSSDQSRVELLGGRTTGGPPFANRARRSSHQIDAAWNGTLRRHQLTLGAAWRTASFLNRYSAQAQAITVGGIPAFAVEFNTPTEANARLHTVTAEVQDNWPLGSGVIVELGAQLDVTRSARIDWTTVSPRAGLAWRLIGITGLTLRASYSRLYAPLAGRHLDSGNPDAFGGSEYFWNDSNGDGSYQPSERGALRLLFGGVSSMPAPGVARPYADQFNVGAEIAVRRNLHAGLRLFRRDDKRRLAELDAGVPAPAYTALPFADPGPDGIDGTFDDQELTVYDQSPETLGQDAFLLTNPTGLRMLHAGLAVELRATFHGLMTQAEFVAEKAHGPTNFGNSIVENDPGVLGTLLQDPNFTALSAGRTFVDRAYVGKLHASYRTPPGLGRINIESAVNYMDGLVFGRQVLVTGLSQGPFLAPATVRGSPEGGHRAEYVINWNLRVSRDFAINRGVVTGSLDVLNVTNAGSAIRQNDLTGQDFNLRLPLAIQPARAVRLNLAFSF